MGNRYEGTGNLPELPESYEEELMDGADGDMEPESDDLRQLLHPIYEANQQSLDRVYARLQSVESRRPAGSPLVLATGQSSATPVSRAKSTPAMSTIKTTVSAPDVAPYSSSQRRSLAPSRLTTIAAVLATGVLLTGTLLGFLYFHGERPSQPGPTSHLSAKLECQAAPFADWDGFPAVNSPEYGLSPVESASYTQMPLDWSTPEDLAYTQPTLVWNPKTCSSTASHSPLQVAMTSNTTIKGWGGQLVFSPDGKRVVVIGAARTGWVLDAQTGSILTRLQMSDDAAIWGGYDQAVWADGGSQIVAATLVVYGTDGYQFTYKVQQWDSHTGALIRTALTLSYLTAPFPWYGAAQVWISPDATHAAMLLANHSLQFWDIATGKLISTTPAVATGSGGTVAWSPDGSYFAFGVDSADPSVTPGQTQIWSPRTGRLVTTLPDTDTFQGVIGALSWSPNGRYLAESSGQITIWDTSTWQQVAVFDRVATSTGLGHGVTRYELVDTLAWSRDSGELASAIHTYDGGPTEPLTELPTITNDVQKLSVWKLTAVTTPTVIPATPLPTPTVMPSPGVSTTPTPTPSSGTPFVSTPIPPGAPTPTVVPTGPSTPTPTPSG